MLTEKQIIVTILLIFKIICNQYRCINNTFNIDYITAALRTRNARLYGGPQYFVPVFNV